MSVAQDEIAEQINSIKVEWKETVDAMHSTAQAPPGMSRADFKEWKQLHQQKAKFRMADLEERLKRLQLLEARLKVVRGKTADYIPNFFGSMPNEPRTREVTAKNLQHFSESERITTGNALASSSDAIHPHFYDAPDMCALPGAVHDDEGWAQRPTSHMTDRAMYQRPRGVPGGGGGGRERGAAGYYLGDESTDILRQMVRESLKLNMVSEDTALESSKVRVPAILSTDPTTPRKAPARSNTATNTSADGNDTGHVSSRRSTASTLHNGGASNTSQNHSVNDDEKAGASMQAANDLFVRTDEKDASFDGMHHEDAGAQETKESADIAHKEVMLRTHQQSWIKRIDAIKHEAQKNAGDEAKFKGVPATLEQAAPVSCSFFFGGFKRKSPIRRFCFETKNNMGFNAFVMFITVANSLYIALAPGMNKPSVRRAEDSWLKEFEEALFWFDIACAIIMGLEVLIGIIAYGMISSPSSYLRNSGFHKLDFICMLFTILEYLAIYWGLPSFTLRPFRMLRFFKPICRIEMFMGVRNIISTLSEGFPQLMIIFLFLLLTLAAWCILGMSMYSKSFRRRCVTRQTDIPVCASDFTTGFAKTCNLLSDVNVTIPKNAGLPAISRGYPFETWCKVIGVEWDQDANGDFIQPTPFNGSFDNSLVPRGYFDRGNNRFVAYPKDEFGRYHTCQYSIWRRVENFTTTQRCEVVGNPMKGFSHFDNVWGSVVSLFQVMVPDSYYDVWGRAQESEPLLYPVTLTVFVVINVLNTFLLLGLFVAVVTGTFKRIRDQAASNFITKKQQDALEQAETRIRHDNNDDDVSGEEAIQHASIELIRSIYFRSFISCAIIVQLVAFGAKATGATQFWRDFVYYSEFVCVFVFLLELILNFLAAGDLQTFGQSLFHQFEAVVIVITFVGVFGGIPEFKVLSAMRGYRLMKYFPTLQAMLQSAVKSVQALCNVIVFIVLVGLCFVVAGRYMFGSLMDDVSRSNFGTFSLAALTMFQLFTGDSWSGVLYASMQVFPAEQILSQFAGAALIMVWFIFASLIASNLFVAVIIENFQISDTIDNINKPGNVDSVRQTFRRTYTQMYRRSSAITSGAVSLDPHTGMLHAGPNTANHVFRKNSARILYENYDHLERQSDKVSTLPMDSAYGSRILRAVVAATWAIPKGQQGNVGELEEPERVLFVLMPQNPIRKFFEQLGESVYFDTLILFVIVLSCFFLIIEPPFTDLVDYPQQVEANEPLVPFATISLCNLIFTCLFSTELVCRVMGQGLFFTKNAYLKEGWNVIDAVVLVFALVEISGVLDGTSLAKIMRMGRALKPLRLMKRNQSMRMVIDALITTLQPIAYVILFLIFTLVVFGLAAIGVFGGKLFFCSSPAVAFPLGKMECSGTWIVQDGNLNGVIFPSVWDNPYYFNFDSFFMAFMSLFMVSTFKYVGIIFACMDITAKDQAPLTNNKWYWSVFFIVYILVGALFVMNLFVAFIIDGFNAAKGSTQAEEIYRRFRRQLLQYRPKYETFKPPDFRISRQLRKLIESKVFQTISTLCVLVNVSMLLADNADASESYISMMKSQNDFFYGELCLEVVLCAIAYGPLGFFNDIWRFFDLFVCVGTAVGYIFNSSAITAFVKVFRLARVIRLAARIKAIRAILETLINTIPQLANVVLLLVLVYSMFAVAGMQLYTTTRFGLRLGPTANYESYTKAIFLIWQLITGDEWMILMADLSVQPPFCSLLFDSESDSSYQGPVRTWGDCGQSFSWMYFLALKLVCEYMMLNLFIGLILDNFSYITEDVGHEEDAIWSNGPSEAQLIEIASVFQRYDRGTGYVPITALHHIMQDLPLPIGYREPSGRLYLKYSHASELLVRAELNLCMRHERATMADEAHMSWYFRAPERKQIYINGVDYETLISTLIFWRLPALVPGIVQWHRHERIEEVVLMAHALQVMDFFKALVAKKKVRKVHDMMAKRRAFMHYCDKDPHRKRRNLHATQVKMNNSQVAKSHKVPLLQLLNQPLARFPEVLLEWCPTSELPEDFISHNKACHDYLMMRMSQPITGIEVFRNKVVSHKVVLKILDPNNQNPNQDLLIADMRKIEWREWHAVNSKHESYLTPQLFSGYDDNGKSILPVFWTRVDLLTHSYKKATSRPKRAGSIEDLQSFVVDDAKANPDKRKNERAHNYLRMNLGNHLYGLDKVKLQAKNWLENRSAFEKGAKKRLDNMKKLQGLAGGAVNEIGKQAKGIAGSTVTVSDTATEREHGLSDENLMLNGSLDISEGDTVLEVVGYFP